MLDHGLKDDARASEIDYHALNAMLNLYDDRGRIRFDADRMAARQYFLSHVNQNTVFFHPLDEKLGYLVDEGYYEAQVLDQYSREFQRRVWEAAYAKKFRFPTFLGAFKYYTSYTLKTRDRQRYLERYEDRVVMVAGVQEGRRGRLESPCDDLVHIGHRPEAHPIWRMKKQSSSTVKMPRSGRPIDAVIATPEN